MEQITMESFDWNIPDSPAPIMKRTYGDEPTSLHLTKRARAFYDGTDPMSIYEYEGSDGACTYTYTFGSDPETDPMTEAELNADLEALQDEIDRLADE